MASATLTPESGTHLYTGSQDYFDEYFDEYFGTVPVELLQGHSFSLTPPGALLVSGGPTSLVGSDSISPEGGTYQKTGGPVNLELGKAVTPTPGVYQVTGTDTDILRDTASLSPTPGVHLYQSLGGTFLVAYRIRPLVPGVFSQTGGSTNLVSSRILTGTGGTYSVTGTDTDLDYFSLSPTPGAYANVGQAPLLLYQETDTLLTLPGSYSTTGASANLEQDRVYTVLSGSYSQTGASQTLIKALTYTVDTGVYEATGTSIDFSGDLICTTTPGTYSQVGSTITYSSDYSLTPTPGSYLLTEGSTNLSHQKTVMLTPGVYTKTGTDIAFTENYAFIVGQTDYDYIGSNSTGLKSHKILPTTPGVYSYTGTDTTVSHSLESYTGTNPTLSVNSTTTFLTLPGQVGPMPCKLYIKQYDTLPDIIATFTDDDGVISLAGGATVDFHLYNRDSGTLALDTAVDITDVNAGTIQYSWQAGDTDVVGEYWYEFEITFGDGTVLTVPNNRNARLEIVDDLA